MRRFYPLFLCFICSWGWCLLIHSFALLFSKRKCFCRFYSFVLSVKYMSFRFFYFLVFLYESWCVKGKTRILVLSILLLLDYFWYFSGNCVVILPFIVNLSREIYDSLLSVNIWHKNRVRQTYTFFLLYIEKVRSLVYIFLFG
jgi:hypothetical protein